MLPATAKHHTTQRYHPINHLQKMQENIILTSHEERTIVPFALQI
jgi:hypothetical protein